MTPRRKAAILLVFIGILTGFFLLRSRTMLTYLEFQHLNEATDSYVAVTSQADVLEQDFISPYGIVHGFSVKIGTFDRHNNSKWNIQLIDPETGNVVAERTYLAGRLQNNASNRFDFKKNVTVTRGKVYRIRISTPDANLSTALAFYIGHGSDLSNMTVNGEEADGALSFAVYGGDFDPWWAGYTIVIALMACLAVWRWQKICTKGEKPLDDRLFGAMMVGFMVLVLLFPFATGTTFTDEWDNLRGGMIIARGGVLYRDYVTQHTPFMYYLCAVFAFLGAGSLRQFRLCYYLMEAVLWAFLYYRHSPQFGKKVMVALPALECLVITVLFNENEGRMVLSDGMQGLCAVVLLLEFLRYYKTRKIKWDNAIIISLSVWASIGSAFISVYALVFVVLIVFILEIKHLIEEKPKLPEIVKRYYALIICMFTPPVLAVIYFKLTHCLMRAFEQFYLFNREVYADYTSFGDNLFEPFISSVMNYVAALSDRFISLITAAATKEDVLQFVVLILATAVLVRTAAQKRYVESLCILLVLIGSASRGYSIHGLAAWYVAVFAIAMFGESLLVLLPRKGALPAVAVIVVILLGCFTKPYGNGLLYESKPIFELESRVVAMTEENEGIYLDAYVNESLYLLYKGRYPINRAVYMLPWYMAWYEQDCIEDLMTAQPNVVIYYPDETVWDYNYFTNSFAEALRENYNHWSENPADGWEYSLWVRK